MFARAILEGSELFFASCGKGNSSLRYALHWAGGTLHVIFETNTNPIMTPLSVHLQVWGYIKGGGRSKYCITGSF
jgi:hypothetical protein